MKKTGMDTTPSRFLFLGEEEQGKKVFVLDVGFFGYPLENREGM